MTDLRPIESSDPNQERLELEAAALRRAFAAKHGLPKGVGGITVTVTHGDLTEAL